MTDLAQIRLELARDHDYPNGSAQHGYEFIAPIDDDGHINATAWKKVREKCRVVRFWGKEAHDVGHLVHKPGGSWAFHYDVHGDPDDDDGGYRFSKHTFNPGDYVSIKDHDDDKLRTFRVVRQIDAEL